MNDDDLSPEEFSVLKTLMKLDEGVVAKGPLIRGLFSKGYVRFEGERAHITVKGHRRYLVDLPATFDD